MTLFTANVICATITWVVLVADGTTAPLTPRRFAQALRRDVEMFGIRTVVFWATLCFVCWWLIWLAWMADWLEPRE